MSPASGASVTHTVGSASIWVLGRVAGPLQTARVLHTGRDATYLDLEGFCLGVLGARAVQVPCGVRTDLPFLAEIEADTEVSISDGVISLPGLEVLVTSIVDTTVPVLSPEDAAWGGEVLDEVVGKRLDPLEAELPGAALEQLEVGDSKAPLGLLGYGGGLTPLGDDVLAGWLAAAVASRHPRLMAVRSTVALEATERTTTLSATLLGCAARGEGVPEFRSLVSGMASANREMVEQAVDLLLRIGDSSGGGLLLGALLALRSPLENDATAAGAA